MSQAFKVSIETNSANIGTQDGEIANVTADIAIINTKIANISAIIASQDTQIAQNAANIQSILSILSGCCNGSTSIRCDGTQGPDSCCTVSTPCEEKVRPCLYLTTLTIKFTCQTY